MPGHPGIWRHYKPGDKFYGPDDPRNRPTGSYYQEVMLGWTINDAGKRVPDRIRPTGDTLAELKQRIDEEKAKRQAGMAANRKAQPLAAYLRQWLCDKYSLVDLAPDDFQPSAFKKLARTR